MWKSSFTTVSTSKKNKKHKAKINIKQNRDKNGEIYIS